MNQHHYVALVLAAYTALPDTPAAARSTDRRTARGLFVAGHSLDTVLGALQLASARRRTRPASAPPLPPIRSLAYFLPVIQEVALTPLDPGYRLYLAKRAAPVQIPAVSDER